MNVQYTGVHEGGRVRTRVDKVDFFFFFFFFFKKKKKKKKKRGGGGGGERGKGGRGNQLHVA